MSNKVAVAKAFLEAGNASRARTEIESLLSEDPHNDLALDVYSLVLRELGEWAKLEDISIERLGRDSQCIAAYANLLLLYQRANRRSDARLLREQYTGVVINSAGLDTLNTVYDIAFGDKASTWSNLSKEAAAQGDHGTSFRFASMAAFHKGNLWDALKDAEFARRTGDNSADLLARISLLNFHFMRFGKCREFARLALQQNPGLQLPKELLIVSWIAYFPPCWMASFCLFAVFLCNRLPAIPSFLAFYAVGPFVAFPLFYLLGVFADLLHVPFWSLVGIGAVYGCYICFGLGSITRRLAPSGSRPVKLKNY